MVIREIRDSFIYPVFTLLKIRIIRRILLRLLALIVLFHFYCLMVLVYLQSGPPLYTTVRVQRRIEACLREEPFAPRHRFIPLKDISPHLRHAVLAAEDGRFYQHGGIDWREVEIVVRETMERPENLRGASTITQQLVKNLFFTTHSNVIRKVFELTLAPLTEHILSKDRILELYLNVVEWGPDIYGIEAASQHYYGIPASALTRARAARLAACLPAPLTRTPAQMDRYSREILHRMDARGW